MWVTCVRDVTLTSPFCSLYTNDALGCVPADLTKQLLHSPGGVSETRPPKNAAGIKWFSKSLSHQSYSA